MPYLGATPDRSNFSDLNGDKLIIDADADTSIHASTDDQIDIEISGADDFQFTANTFTVLSGSTLTVASGATIANSGTATGFGGSDPSSADGDTLGTASAEWSDLYLADGGVIYFGNDQEVTLTHNHDTSLTCNLMVAATTFEPTGDTAAGDNSALGYTSVLGAILTGQGSTNDVTLVNDADATVLGIPTGTTTVNLAGALYASNGSAGSPSISFASDTNTGWFWSASDTMHWSSGGTQRWHMDGTGHLFINDTGNAQSVNGITLNQLAWDDNIITFKSSDIAHGITGRYETDTYAAFAKGDGTNGGLAIRGIHESNSQGIYLNAITVDAANTTDATNAQAVLEVVSQVKSGTGTTAVADAGNLMMVANDTNCRWLVKGDGDIHQTTDAHTALDAEDDTAVIRAFTKEISVKGVIENEFDQRMVRSREYLEEIGLLGHVTPEEHAQGVKPLFNASLLMKFHDGAIWQTRSMVETLRSAEASYFDKLKSKIEECLTDLADRPVTLDIEDFGEFSTAALAQQQLPALSAFNE